jgi:hypothetical protein
LASSLHGSLDGSGLSDVPELRSVDHSLSSFGAGDLLLNRNHFDLLDGLLLR